MVTFEVFHTRKFLAIRYTFRRYNIGYCVVITAAPTDVTCWERLNDLLYMVARKCGWLDIIQGKLVGPHKLVF